jgi:hypothetical protein
MKNKAASGYSFVHSSSFGKQVLATSSIWPQFACNGSRAKPWTEVWVPGTPANDHQLLTSSESAKKV